MTEVVIGAVLIAVIAYTTGFLTGQYISHRTIRRLKTMYRDAIHASAYLNGIVAMAMESKEHMEHLDKRNGHDE